MPKPARFVQPFRQNTDFMATIIALTENGRYAASLYAYYY